MDVIIEDEVPKDTLYKEWDDQHRKVESRDHEHDAIPVAQIGTGLGLIEIDVVTCEEMDSVELALMTKQLGITQGHILGHDEAIGLVNALLLALDGMSFAAGTHEHFTLLRAKETEIPMEQAMQEVHAKDKRGGH